MSINPEILRAAKLYCCDRQQFTAELGVSINPIHKDWLDMTMLNTTTRPDLAEIVPMDILGYEGKERKHGYDGYDPITPRDVEAKIRMAMVDDKGKLPSSLTSITINDPSDNIFQKYEKDNPLFVFAYYINGHLVVCFHVEWSVLRPLYAEGIAKIKAKGNGARNFSISAKQWINACSVAWSNPDPAVVALLPKSLKPAVIQCCATAQNPV